MATSTRALAQFAPVLFVALGAAAQNSIDGLGQSLPVLATGMSSNSTHVVGPYQGLAYLWDSTGATWVPLNGGGGGTAKVSSDGSFVSSDMPDPNNNNWSTAARWSSSTLTFQIIPGLGSSSGTSVSTAYDISGDGQTVVGLGWVTPGSAHAFKWTPTGGTVDIDTTPGTSSRANAISRDGSTIVGWDADNSSAWDACIWKNGIATYPGSLDPGNPVFGSGECHGVSGDGTYVVGKSNNRAFRWSQAGGMVNLGFPAGTARATATGVSDDGTTVIGWSGSSFLDSNAIIWRPEYGSQVVDLLTLLQSLSVPNANLWTRLATAVDVSPDGAVICGWGMGPNAAAESFIVRLPRPPTTYCTSGTTSSGCAASISANVNPNLAQSNGCTITVANVEGQKTGIVFYGLTQLVQPWCSTGGGTSFLCIKPPTMRTGVQNSGGSSGTCNGSLTLDWNAFQNATIGALGAPWMVGEQAYVQGWFRDPAACKTTSLSNALQITYQP